MGDIFFLSGLPRSGSTLLSSILSQNPSIHTEGTSALCQLMWDVQVSCWNTEQMPNKPEIEGKLLASIPKTFYEGVQQNIIIDKCRTWPLPANLELIKKYITERPKIIITVRPIVEVVKSFVYIRTLNNHPSPEVGLLDDGSNIMRSLEGINYAKANNSGQFLVVSYNDLVDNTKEVIQNIYDFCNWDKFKHKFTAITNPNLERDDLLGLIGLHDIRPEIERRKLELQLSDELYEKAIQLDKH
jgi:sulfotransferase